MGLNKKLAEKLAKKHKDESGEAGGKKLVLHGIGDASIDRARVPVFNMPTEAEENEDAPPEE